MCKVRQNVLIYFLIDIKEDLKFTTFANSRRFSRQCILFSIIVLSGFQLKTIQIRVIVREIRGYIFFMLGGLVLSKIK